MAKVFFFGEAATTAMCAFFRREAMPREVEWMGIVTK